MWKNLSPTSFTHTLTCFFSVILDEPSNDLDVEVLRALEEALLQFAGCAIVVSHDRYFLDRVATHILGKLHSSIIQLSES